MNKEALFLFLILLLGLVLCSFLGGSNCTKEGYTNTNSTTTTDTYPNISNQTKLKFKKDKYKYKYEHNHYNSYDNYNHYTGSSTLVNGTVFYGPNGATAEYIVASDGSASIKLIQTEGGSSYVVFNSAKQGTHVASANTTQTDTTFYGPNGFTATIRYGKHGINTLVFTLPNGTIQVFVQNTNSSNITNTEYYGSVGTNMPPSSSYSAYYGPYGGSAAKAQGYYGGSAGYVQGPNGNTAYYAQGPNGNTVAGTTDGNAGYDEGYYGGSAGYYQGYYGGNAGYVQGPNGNTAYYAQGPNGNTVAGTTDGSSSSIYGGIPASQIPPGQEDLYILKSEIVPPVCPACPSSSVCPSTSKETCPPCPACARCPEPAFECKKVPNYDAISEEDLPQPILSTFSTFGA